MTKEEIFALMNSNPVFHLATVEGDQPRVRAVFLYRADADGIVFHTGVSKDLYRQLEANRKVELCFNDAKTNAQIRVSGRLEQEKDRAYKDELFNHPTREFMRAWVAAGIIKDLHNDTAVYRLQHGAAVVWTMQTNFAPKETIVL
jgi:pyridoxamine 5'-phosphate oxidase